jgi:O-antigen ligase
MEFDRGMLGGTFPAWPNTTFSASNAVVHSAEAKALTRDRILFIAFIVLGYIVPTIADMLTSTLPENLFWFASFAVASAALIRDRRDSLALLRASMPLVLLILLAVCSTIWSDDPSTTLRRSIALVVSGTVALCAVRRLGLQEFVNTLGVGIAILALISSLLITFLPDIGRTPDGEWQGFFARKNTFAQVMTLGLITWACRPSPKSSEGRVMLFGLLCLIMILLVGAQSGTSLVVTLLTGIIGVGLLSARRRFRNRPKLFLFFALCASLIAGACCSIAQDAALDALGKDTTLTGRTEVWQFTTEAIAERPILGYGYKVFWLSNGAADPSERTGTWATQAHNGLIETGLDLGSVGIVAAIFFIITALIRASLCFWNGTGALSIWPLLILGSTILTNFTEATLFKYFDVSWVIVVAAFLFATDAQSARCARSPQVISTP